MSGLDLVRASAPARFRRDRAEGKILGVCRGLADYFGIDPLIVRGVFVIGALCGAGSFVLIYLVLALLAD